MDNILNSVNKLEDLYGNLTYFDQYGTSVIIFLLLTLIVFLVHSYCFVMINAQPIKDDWVNQRCYPSNIPFAGLINKPDDKTASQFTKENFFFSINLKSILYSAPSTFNFSRLIFLYSLKIFIMS